MLRKVFIMSKRWGCADCLRLALTLVAKTLCTSLLGDTARLRSYRLLPMHLFIAVAVWFRIRLRKKLYEC